MIYCPLHSGKGKTIDAELRLVVARICGLRAGYELQRGSEEIFEVIKRYCNLVVVVVCKKKIALDGVKQAKESLFKNIAMEREKDGTPLF